MKKIIVGSLFRLPQMERKTFDRLRKSVNYEGQGMWRVTEGTEVVAFKVMSEIFNGFSIVKVCPDCSLEFDVSLGALYSTISVMHFEAHGEIKRKQIEEENRFAKEMVAYLEFVEDEDLEKWKINGRRCPYCMGASRGYTLGFYSIVFRCKLCKEQFSAQVGEEYIRKIERKKRGWILPYPDAYLITPLNSPPGRGLNLARDISATTLEKAVQFM